MGNKIDIKHRNRVIINGANGQRLTKIRGSVDPTKEAAKIDMGIPAEAYQQQETRRAEKKEEASKDVSLDKLTPEEQKQLKSLMAKL